MMPPIRLTVVMTHPVQYCAPWFRYITEHCRDLELTVLYATEPTPAQRGVGFQTPVEWGLSLTDGYHCRILRPSQEGDNPHASAFWGMDAEHIAEALEESKPDVLLLPGWHSISYVRALWWARRHRIPVLYRGDTNLDNSPTGVRAPLWRLKSRLVLRAFAGALSVGAKARRYLVRFGVPAERIFDSPHCVDNRFFAAAAAPHQTPDGRRVARDRFGFRADDFVVAFVGKLQERKRPTDLVDAVARLGAGAALLVIGAGPLKDRVEEQARRAGVRVRCAGFLNQVDIGCAYAAADCLALPSDEGETWGLVVNEALAMGLPCVVSDRVGCAPDLISPGETGEVFPAGDVAALAAALARVRLRLLAGHDFAASCRARAAAYSFETATRGLLDACTAVTSTTAPRILAACGEMVNVFGLERMTFEALRALKERGAQVHCVVNSWEHTRVAALADAIGAAWSPAYQWHSFSRHTRNPVTWAQFAWNVLGTSGRFLGEAWRFRPTHVFVPEYLTAIRVAPALMLLRLLGVAVILRVPNPPDDRPFYRWLWGRVLTRLVSRFVAISAFCARRLAVVGVPVDRTLLIYNSVSRRALADGTDADVVALTRSRRTLLCVGQIAPFKGTQLVIDATLELLRRGHDLQAVIVGPFPDWPPDLVAYADELRQRVAASETPDRVHFVGERENVPEIMRHAYLLVAPILQEECFGNVALEAKSVGLPVVAFPSGGLVETVEHGRTGYLCSARTVAGLIEGLEYLLTDPARREAAGQASLTSFAEADQWFSRESFGRRWWGLVRELQRSRAS